MMFSLLLGLAVFMLNKHAEGGVLLLDQDTWGKAEQCKEMIVQHILTHGKSQFDPEVVRNCIAFLRSEDLEHHDEHPVGAIISEKFTNKQVEIITTQPISEKVPVTLDERVENSELADNKVKKYSQVTSENKGIPEKLKNPFSNEDSKTIPPEDDDVVEMYPENIVQEWPAVEMVRKKRSNGKEETTGLKLTTKDNMDMKEKQSPQGGLEKHMKEDSQETSESDESPEKPRYPFLGKDYKPPPPKDEDLVDIYPEKPVPEWPAVAMSRRKRGTGREQATKVKAKSKKDTDPIVSPGRPPWEQYTLQDHLELDERGRDRPQTRIQLLIFYLKRFISWLKTRLGLGPRVVQA